MSGTLIVRILTDDTGYTQTVEALVAGPKLRVWIQHDDSAAVLRTGKGVTSGTDHGTGDYSFGLTNDFVALREYMQASGAQHGLNDYWAVRHTDRDEVGAAAHYINNQSAAKVNSYGNMSITGELA